MKKPHLRSIGINDFIRWQAEGSLVLSPKFQRRRVWPPKARSFLIDTIVRGFPIPKIYMRQHLDLATSRTIHEVVDGQQRLQAVLDFRAGNLRLPAEENGQRGLPYDSLSPQAKEEFLTYEFSVDLLINAADADVLNIFARINSHAVPLNAQEKRNAKYFGAFKSTVYALGFEHLEFWKKYKILSDATVARMREAELTSELLVAMTEGLQDKKKSLDKHYEMWDDRYPQRTQVVERFHDVVDLLDQQLGTYLKTSHFRRPALFYSLFLAVYELRYASLGSLKGGRQTLATKEGNRLVRALEHLDAVLKSEKTPAKYASFVAACQRQTDNVSPRRTRHRTILSEYANTV